jgi:Zn-dependent protease
MPKNLESRNGATAAGRAVAPPAVTAPADGGGEALEHAARETTRGVVPGGPDGMTTGHAGSPWTASPDARAETAEDYLPKPGPAPTPTWKRVLGPLGAAGVVLLKFGAKAKGLLLLLPKLKLFSTSASMLVSIGAYALIWGWRFAIGFVLLLLVHEYGHVLQLRREGIKATAPMFIPFLGAFVGMKEMPRNAAAEARVGLAGPVLGSLACLVPVALYLATGSELFKALAFIGFFLNLFNLLPVLPLDGGRAMAALSPWIWLVGFALLAAGMVAFPTPIMLIVLLLGGFETWRRWKARNSPESQRYNEVRPATRAAVAAVYVGLAVALAAGMSLTFVTRA